MEARVVTYVTWTKEDLSAIVPESSQDTDVNTLYLRDHAKKSWFLTKHLQMEFSTSWTNSTTPSQFIATFIQSQVLHGLWSSPTLCKTRTSSMEKHSICTTFQPTKTRLNGTVTAFQSPVCSPSGMFPLTGVPHVISWPIKSTFVITFARHSLKTTFSLCLI